MNIEEARNILQAYRDDLELEESAELAEALEMAETEPELLEFLENERAFDQAFTAKLLEVTPPEGLRDKILAGKPDSPAAGPQFEPAAKIAWWRQTVVWAAAACVAGLLVLGVFLARPPADSETPQMANVWQLDEFIESVAGHARTVHGAEQGAGGMQAIYALLAESQAPTPANLPDRLTALRAAGCMSYDWNGNRIGVICLKGDKVYHLYIAEPDGSATLPASFGPDIREFEDLAVASWSSDGQILVLTVEGTMSDLSPLL